MTAVVMIRCKPCREFPKSVEGVAVSKTKLFVLSAVPLTLTLVVSACSSGASTAIPTTTTTAFVAATINLAPTTTIPATTTIPVATTTTTTTPVISATATEWEVVVGVFTTSAKAQAQIDKLTAAKFVPFSIKPVTGKFAVVLPGLTNAAATAMVAKINAAKVGSARVFHLTGAEATNFEVVDGIFPTSAKAQEQIDKLTKANLLGFTIKPIPGEFAVVLAGLTQAQASALVKKVDAAGLGPSRVKELL